MTIGRKVVVEEGEEDHGKHVNDGKHVNGKHVHGKHVYADMGDGWC